MKKLALVLIVTIGITSCVPKSDFDNKEQENQLQRDTILELKEEIYKLKTYIYELEVKVEEKQKQELTCTEDFALEQLKSYLSFYAPKCKFRDFKVRPNGNCVYDISMNKYFDDGTIVGVIVRLKFNNDGTYNISNIHGDPTWACN